jgi:hypothetical protein
MIRKLLDLEHLPKSFITLKTAFSIQLFFLETKLQAAENGLVEEVASCASNAAYVAGAVAKSSLIMKIFKFFLIHFI